MAKRLVKVVAWIIGALGVLTIATIGRIDRSPVAERSFYKRMETRLDTTRPGVFPSRGALACGWARVNITPDATMPMAGYSPRDGFDAVHDSLYARILLVDNGSATVAFVNVDLLLFPALLKYRIEEKLDSIGDSPFLYLSATHTHNGIGGWDNTVAGRIAFGSFQQDWVEGTAAGIVSAITKIEPRSSQLNYWEADASDRVENRIDRENGETDGMIRGIRIVRADSTSAILFTFSAHPTAIEKDSRTLSADYPGAVISRLEETYDFGMFMAGMVGSHRFAWVPETGFEFIDAVGPELAEKIMTASSDSAINSPEIGLLHLPIEFGPAQPRISRNLKIRDWFVRMLAHPLKGEATVVEIGNILFIGLPCDFSGEIFARENFGELARVNGKRVIITSFNGDYNGYITFDAHYENGTAEEVNATNWVGPGYGSYFAGIVASLIGQEKK
jgi:neutral ceramidase